MIGQHLFDKQEGAKELHVSISLLEHLTAAKKIGHLKLGRRCYYTQDDLEAYMASRRVEPVVNPRAQASKGRASAAGQSRRGAKAAAAGAV